MARVRRKIASGAVSLLVVELTDRKMRNASRFGRLSVRAAAAGDVETAGTCSARRFWHEQRADAPDDGRPVTFPLWQIPQPWRPNGDRWKQCVVFDGGQIELM